MAELNLVVENEPFAPNSVNEMNERDAQLNNAANSSVQIKTSADEISTKTKAKDSGNTRKLLLVSTGMVINVIVIVVVALLLNRDRDDGSAGNKLPENELPENEYEHAAVASDVPLCSSLGRDILKDGGSAVDAAITVTLCVGVVNPQSSGLGGGFFMTVYSRDTGIAETLDAREPSPAAATPDVYEDNELKAKNGPLSICVPTEAAGLWEVHQRYGKLPWKDLFQPVIKLAEAGYPMTDHTEYALHFRNDRGQLTDPGLRARYLHVNGSIKSVGDWITTPALAHTLRRLSVEGPEVFYSGDMAQKMVEELQDIGGILTAQDFLSYKPSWVQPHRTNILDTSVLLAPPLPSLGAILQFIVRAMDVYGVSASSFADFNSTVQAYHHFIEIQKFGFGMRKHLGDKNSSEVEHTLSLLLSDKFVKETLRKIRKDQVTYSNVSSYSDLAGVSVPPDAGGSTSHVSVVAENGDAVSLTTTVDWYFGSFILSNATGIVYNNHMADFRSGTPNDIGRGKKSISSMCGSIVIDEASGDAILVVGTAGGRRIITTNSWIIFRTLMTEEDLSNAVKEPRVHNPLSDSNTLLCQEGFSKEIANELITMGHQVKYERYGSSSANCILRLPNGHLVAVSDPRKGRHAAGY